MDDVKGVMEGESKMKGRGREREVEEVEMEGGGEGGSSMLWTVAKRGHQGRSRHPFFYLHPHTLITYSSSSTFGTLLLHIPASHLHIHLCLLFAFPFIYICSSWFAILISHSSSS